MSERKRPNTWDVRPIREKPGTPEYETAVIKREQELLMPWVNEPAIGGEMYFATNRATIGEMALPYVLRLLQEDKLPRAVLEIGGGEGKALLYLLAELDTYVSLPKVIFTMTSLSHQPQHRVLKEKGIDLKVPQIAEALPSDWSDSFDVVLTSSLLGWVSIAETMSEIKRVLRQGGYWMNMDARGAAPIGSNMEYQMLLPRHMSDLGMHNSISEDEWLHWMREDIFPIIYRKD